MAYKHGDFVVKFQSRAHTHAFYKTDDAAADVDTAGYFNDEVNILPIGSIIDVVVDAAGTPAFGRFVVTSNDGTTVDVANIQDQPGTDTD